MIEFMLFILIQVLLFSLFFYLIRRKLIKSVNAIKYDNANKISGYEKLIVASINEKADSGKKELINSIASINEKADSEKKELINSIISSRDFMFDSGKKELINSIINSRDFIFESFKSNIDVINRVVQNNISTYALHQKTFLQFKNINSGKDVVIVATGPSLKEYKPINAISIGVNSAFTYENIKLNYLFIQDYLGAKNFISEAIDYMPNECIKFFGLTTEYDKSINRVIPESISIKAGALRYRTDWSNVPFFQPAFSYDIASQPLGCMGSVVFPAMQFALWTNPRRIFLVGCDCSFDGHFNDQPQEVDLTGLIGIWEKLKEFKNIYYPDIEIISVNPVGLKGIFKEIDTDSLGKLDIYK